MMKRVYKCDYCEKIFNNQSEAKKHESCCGYNPKNKINDKLIFRLSMIYEDLTNIIACAVYEIAKDELDFLYLETERAGSTNCPYMINKHKLKMLTVFREAGKVANKHDGRDSSTYKDVIKENPEIFQAVVDTLKRKAWNEY